MLHKTAQHKLSAFLSLSQLRCFSFSSLIAFFSVCLLCGCALSLCSTHICLQGSGCDTVSVKKIICVFQNSSERFCGKWSLTFRSAMCVYNHCGGNILCVCVTRKHICSLFLGGGEVVRSQICTYEK